MRTIDEKYDSYCDLVSNLSDKKNQLAQAQSSVAQLGYQIKSLENKIERIKRNELNNPSIFNSAIRMKINDCLEQIMSYDTGGQIVHSPMADFMKSEIYRNYSTEDKANFNLVKKALISRQYNIQNALTIAEEDGGFELSSNPIFKDYINETVTNLDNYEDMSADKIVKIKEIMYNFVEHVSI